MKRILFFVGISIICFFSNSSLSKTMGKNSDILEEVVPIREKGFISGIKYYITLPENYKYKEILNTHIIDSIYHYKDLNTIKSISVTIVFDNKTDKDYYLEDIYVRREDILVNHYSKKINILKKQKKNISFVLQEPLFSDCSVQLRLLK